MRGLPLPRPPVGAIHESPAVPSTTDKQKRRCHTHQHPKKRGPDGFPLPPHPRRRQRGGGRHQIRILPQRDLRPPQARQSGPLQVPWPGKNVGADIIRPQAPSPRELSAKLTEGVPRAILSEAEGSFPIPGSPNSEFRIPNSEFRIIFSPQKTKKHPALRPTERRTFYYTTKQGQTIGVPLDALCSEVSPENCSPSRTCQVFAATQLRDHQ